MLKELVTKCRSYRRFYQDIPIPREDLLDMIDTARLTPSAANAQALKFKILDRPEECEALFPNLLWAKALENWGGPEKGERPSAYIVILWDLSIGRNRQWDSGIAAQTILLSSVEKGFGGCMLASLRRQEAMRILDLDPERYYADLVIALGKPKETVVLEPVGPEGSTAYYRDENQVHHVPKRSLKEILV